MDRRVRTGCITCRKRRVKCDETRPVCTRCRSANFECEGYPPPRRAPQPPTSSPKLTPPPVEDEGSSFGELSFRHTNWRQDQLPLYHHFVTSTVVRLFRTDHVQFWRDQVAQMSYGLDVVYEALLAIGAMHRSNLLFCRQENRQEAAKSKMLGLRAYGETLKLLSSHLGQTSIAEVSAVLIVLMLLAYFECLVQNPKGAFRHLWAAIQLLRSTENKFSDAEVSNLVPVYDAMLRLDFSAQKLVPYARSSLWHFSGRAMMESPFWNRTSPKFSEIGETDSLASERYCLMQLICGHDRLSRVVWGCWLPAGERPTRDELLAFYSEMKLWKSNSPATLASFEVIQSTASDNLNLSTMDSLPMPPPPYYFSSKEAALNVAMYNAYMGCTLAMIALTERDPQARELEAFNLVYENLRIAAGLLERRGDGSYKPCDSISLGCSTYLYHSARRCYSRTWQNWTIDALRSIGREGLSNGHTLANTLQILCQLEDRMRRSNLIQPQSIRESSSLGTIRDRLIPLLVPHGEEDKVLAFFLRYGNSQVDRDEQAMQVVAKATWKETPDGKLHSMKLVAYESSIAEGHDISERPEALELFHSWRDEVERGWHGYLTKEVQEGFLQKEAV